MKNKILLLVVSPEWDNNRSIFITFMNTETTAIYTGQCFD